MRRRFRAELPLGPNRSDEILLSRIPKEGGAAGIAPASPTGEFAPREVELVADLLEPCGTPHRGTVAQGQNPPSRSGRREIERRRLSAMSPSSVARTGSTASSSRWSHPTGRRPHQRAARNGVGDTDRKLHFVDGNPGLFGDLVRLGVAAGRPSDSPERRAP